MDSFVLAVGAVVLVGMVFMLMKTASIIHQAPRPEGEEKQKPPRSDGDKAGRSG